MSRSSSLASVGSTSDEKQNPADDNLAVRGSALRSGSKGAVVLKRGNSGHVPRSITLQDVISTDMGGGGVTVVGGGDHEDDSDEPAIKPKTRKSKKLLLLWSLVVYCVICGSFFIASAIIMIVLWFRQMQYFIREPHTVALFDVINNVFWIFLAFLIGSLMHITLTIFTICILVGVRQTEKLVIRHKEKLMMWVFITACIGEYIMFSGTMNHMGSAATVDNGQAKDTLVPFILHMPKVKKCFAPDIAADNSKASHLEVNLVRANLKWMTQVTCGSSSIDAHTPTWQSVLNRAFTGFGSKDDFCRKLKSQLVEDARKDCFLMNFLDGVVFAWLILDMLGIWFCIGVFYLYLKAVVRVRPGRFSFAESTYQDDVEALKDLAAKVSRFAKHNNSVDAEHEQSEHRHSRGHLAKEPRKPSLQPKTEETNVEPQSESNVPRKKVWRVVIKRR